MFTGINPVILSGGLSIDKLFATTLYTSQNAPNQKIPLQFQPDLVWLRQRNINGNAVLYDSVRQTREFLTTSATNAGSVSGAGYGELLLDGFNGGIYAANQPVVSWSFKRRRRFFDVIKYTGNETARAIPHSLGVTPGMVIIKSYDAATNWNVWHVGLTGLSSNPYIRLNSSSTYINDPAYFPQAPDANNIYIGNIGNVNASGFNFVAYVFANDFQSNGVIKCGTYTPSGGSAVPVNLGWEAQWLLVKGLGTGTANWQIADNKRNGVNAGTKYAAFPNSTIAEVDINGLNFTSTGFTVSANDDWNRIPADRYLYMAIRKGKA